MATGRNNGLISLSISQVCLSLKTLEEIRAQVKKINQTAVLSEEEHQILNLIERINAHAQIIQSVDLPTDDKNNDVMVKMVQEKADFILKDDKKSWLRKIMEVAAYAKEFGAGNCMEKAFYGFAAMLCHMQNEGLCQNGALTLKLAFFKNHFIVIVNERFFMDPWLNLVFPIKGSNDPIINHVFDGFGKLTNYFSIDANWKFQTHEVRKYAATKSDAYSNQDLSACLQEMAQSKHFAVLQKRKKVSKSDSDSDSDSEEKREDNKGKNTSYFQFSTSTYFSSTNRRTDQRDANSLPSFEESHGSNGIDYSGEENTTRQSSDEDSNQSPKTPSLDEDDDFEKLTSKIEKNPVIQKEKPANTTSPKMFHKKRKVGVGVPENTTTIKKENNNKKSYF